ncbi:uncharacterized protein C12orf76 homolog [Pelodytes ibericus]
MQVRGMEIVLITVSLFVTGMRAQTDTVPAQIRPYAVLLRQNLVLLGSILSVLLIAMILLAVCVYKPIRRR